MDRDAYKLSGRCKYQNIKYIKSSTRWNKSKRKPQSQQKHLKDKRGKVKLNQRWVKRKIVSQEMKKITSINTKYNLDSIVPKSKPSCPICPENNDNNIGDELLKITCRFCIDYLLKKAYNLRLGNPSKIQICSKCSISADICTAKRTSTLCMKQNHCTRCKIGNSRKKRPRHWGMNQEYFMQRTNDLFESLTFEWKKDVIAYKINSETLAKWPSQLHKWMPPSKIGNEHYIVYCKRCSESLKECCIPHCKSRTEKYDKICFHHSCVTCNKIPLEYSHEKLQCGQCKQMYCYYSSDFDFYSHCGSVYQCICKRCFILHEQRRLKFCVLEAVPFCEVIVDILCEYAIGCLVICNIRNCKNEIAMDSVFQLHSCVASDTNGNRITNYRITKDDTIRKYHHWMTQIGDLYFRIRCAKCTVDNNFECCAYYPEPYRCMNTDEFIGSNTKHYQCLNHVDDYLHVDDCICGVCSDHSFVTECDICHCKCCDRCYDNGKHKIHCRKYQISEWNSIDRNIKQYDYTNMNSFGVVAYKSSGKRKYKNNKYYRTYKGWNKNKRKPGAQQKRDKDKRGKAKCNQRWVKRKIVTLEIEDI